MMCIVRGCAFVVYGLGSHSAMEGIMCTQRENVGEGYAFRHFDQWPFFFQMDLRLVCLIILPILVYDSIVQFRWGMLLAMLLSMVSGLALGWFVHLVVYFLVDIISLVVILLYPLEGISFVVFILLFFVMIPYQLPDDFEGIASAQQKEKKKQEAAFAAAYAEAQRAKRESEVRSAASYGDTMTQGYASSMPDTIQGPYGTYRKRYAMGDYAEFTDDAGHVVRIHGSDIGCMYNYAENSYGHFNW